MKKRKADKVMYYKSSFKQLPHLYNEITRLEKMIITAKKEVGSLGSPSDWESIRLENAVFDPHADTSFGSVWELTMEKHAVQAQIKEIEKALDRLPEDIKDMIERLYIKRTQSYSGVAVRYEKHSTEIQRLIDKALENL